MIQYFAKQRRYTFYTVNTYSPYSFCQHNSMHSLFCCFIQSYFDVNPFMTTFMALLSVMLPKDRRIRICHIAVDFATRLFPRALDTYSSV